MANTMPPRDPNDDDDEEEEDEEDDEQDDEPPVVREPEPDCLGWVGPPVQWACSHKLRLFGNGWLPQTKVLRVARKCSCGRGQFTPEI
jgi:hypothetical protein